jgi:hypothetical protein
MAAAAGGAGLRAQLVLGAVAAEDRLRRVAEVEDVGALDVELEAVLVMSPTLMLEYPLGVLVCFP